MAISLVDNSPFLLINVLYAVRRNTKIKEYNPCLYNLTHSGSFKAFPTRGGGSKLCRRRILGPLNDLDTSKVRPGTLKGVPKYNS